MGLALLLTAFGAVTTAVFVEHRYHGRGLRPRVYGWAIGPALMMAVPLLLVIGVRLIDPGAFFVGVLMAGDWFRLGWQGPILMLSLWTFLYLAVSVVCWLAYRLVASEK